MSNRTVPYPLPGYPIGPIDERTGENYGTSEAHATRHRGPAVDIPAPLDTPVPATTWCGVEATGDDGDGVERGKWVRLWWLAEDLSLLQAEYCHLSRIDVVEGQALAPGDVFGLVGQTGDATGPHIHYKLFVARVRVRPEDWLTPELAEALPEGADEEEMPRTERQQVVIANLRNREAYLRQLSAELAHLQHPNYSDALVNLANDCGQDAGVCEREWPA